jgi:hypothetical protein
MEAEIHGHQERLEQKNEEGGKVNEEKLFEDITGNGLNHTGNLSSILVLRKSDANLSGEKFLCLKYPFNTFWLECVATTLKSHVKRSCGYAF